MTPLSRRAMWLGSAVAAVITALVWRLDPPGAWRVLLTEALWWSAIAAGAGAFDCVLALTGAEWSAPLRPAVRGLTALLPGAAVVIAALAAGMWPLFQSTAIWVPLRDAAALVILYAVLRVGAQRTRSPAWASAGLLVFTAVLSLLATDLVMRFDPDWTSTLFPAFFAFAGLYGAVVVIVLLARVDRRAIAGDLSRVLLGLLLVWVYLFWSQYLVIWYGNLPHEFVFLLPRTHGGWRGIATAVLICCAGAPFLLLLPRRSAGALVFAAASAGVGLWLEMLLLVYPPQAWHGADVAIALAATSAGALCAAGFAASAAGTSAI